MSVPGIKKKEQNARLLKFGEDVPASFHYAVARKKRLRLLSEVVLRTVKRRLTSSFAIFLTKKWRRERDSNPRRLAPRRFSRPLP